MSWLTLFSWLTSNEIQEVTDALQGVDDKGIINVDETYCRVMTALDRMGKLD